MIINEYEKNEYVNQMSTSDKRDSSINNYYLDIKRILDFLFSIIIFIPCTIVFLLCGLLIKLESNGEIFYKQIRVGKNGEKFTVYKLRTMLINSDCIGPLYTEETDKRITKVGKILRRFRIDELPQILNIIQGKMSFIGPRPLTNFEYENSSEDFKKRLLVLPGISGLAQVSGGNYLTNDQKLDCDLSYISKMSFKFDVIITIQTIMVIMTGHGAR